MPKGKSQAATTAEMPTYVNTQHINMETLLALQADAESDISGNTDSTKESSPGKDLFDMSKLCFFFIFFLTGKSISLCINSAHK